MLTVAGALISALSACGDPCHPVELCDIKDSSCQQSIMDAVVCMRGGKAVLPPVHVITPQAFLDRVTANDTLDDAALARAEQWNQGLSMFALAPPSYDRSAITMAQLADVVAAYFNDKSDIVILDRGTPLNDDNAVATLAHELVHALQDVDHGLSKLKKKWATTYDSRLALEGLIEGEATHYQLLAMVDLMHHKPDDLKWQDYYAKWRGDELAKAEADDNVLSLAVERFAYAFGGGFVSQTWLARGRAGIEQLYADPPRTTREIMFGPTDEDVADDARGLRERGEPELAGNFESVGFASLGAWIARVFAGKMDAPLEQRLLPARAMAADVFSVQSNPDSGELIAAWRVQVLAGESSYWPPANNQFIRAWKTSDPNEQLLVAGLDAAAPSTNFLAWRAVGSGGDAKDTFQTSTAVEPVPPLSWPGRACIPRTPKP